MEILVQSSAEEINDMATLLIPGFQLSATYIFGGKHLKCYVVPSIHAAGAVAQEW